jgi:hypothetical protein
MSVKTAVILRLNGTNGFIIDGKRSSDFFGENMANLGDVNGDGADDLLVLSRHATVDDKVVAGEAYVIYGSKSGFPPRFDLHSLDGTNGFTIGGKNAYDALGFTQLNGLGDVNGDGLNDIIISAMGAFGSAGETYIIYGTSCGFPSRFDLNSLDGTNGFTMRGDTSGVYSGACVMVSKLGDVNGDSLADIGFSQQRERTGKLTVVYGQFNNKSSTCCKMT